MKIKLTKIHGNEYSWACPTCKGSFTYSPNINRMWGHPIDKLYCAVCCKYYDIDTEEDLKYATGLRKKELQQELQTIQKRVKTIEIRENNYE